MELRSSRTCRESGKTIRITSPAVASLNITNRKGWVTEAQKRLSIGRAIQVFDSPTCFTARWSSLSQAQKLLRSEFPRTDGQRSLGFPIPRAGEWSNCQVRMQAILP